MFVWLKWRSCANVAHSYTIHIRTSQYRFTYCYHQDSGQMASSINCDLPKNNRGIWLVVGTLTTITGIKLPSNQQVLQRFFHLHKVESQTISASATATMQEVTQFSKKACIPIRKNCHIIATIEDLHLAWIGMKKNASHRTDTQKEKERQFTENLHDFFDIAHAVSLTMIKLPEDRQFLQAQREKESMVAWVLTT